MRTRRPLPPVLPVLCLLGFALLAACSKPTSVEPSTAPGTAAETAAGQLPAPEHESWNLYRIQGQRAGYDHTTIRRLTEGNREVLVIRQEARFTVRRFGQETRQELDLADRETPEGRLLDFQLELRQGPTPLRLTGRVEGPTMLLEQSAQGRKITKTVPWPADAGGFLAVASSLRRQAMKPGERRTIRHLDAGGGVAKTELTAAGQEPVQLLSGKSELLRIASVEKMSAGQTVRGAIWTDRAGEILKTWTETLGSEAIRAPKEIALAETGPANFDLGLNTLVKLDRPIPCAHETKRVRYRVRLESGNPARAFLTGPSQKVKSLDEHTAEITVFAIRPGRTDGNSEAPADPPTDADRQPSHFIGCDDVKVVADARQAVGSEINPWRAAVALEGYAQQVMTKQDFSQAFATAADVAQTRKGDCTEHAVYLAALARAQGLPARVAVGLVYMEGQQAMGFHMWTEVFVEGRWIPLDSTLGRGGIGASHLKLVQSSMEGIAPYMDFFTVAEVAKKLKIEVVEVE